MTPCRSVVLILADGARYDVFEELLAAGQLPHIRAHIVERGGYSRMTTVFTSTTGPAYLPFVTGCYPGTANVPGIRWFDKRAFADNPWWSPHRFRSYCGWEAFFMNRDIRPGIRTVFDLTDHPISIFNPITRGVRRGHNIGSLRKSWMISRAHTNGKYEPVDQKGAQLLIDALARRSEFYFLALPGIDGISHNTHPRHERTLAAYRKVDDTVRDVAVALQSMARYDETVIAVCSDHGLSPTHTHFDVPVFMEKTLSIRTMAYTNIFRRNPEASAHVSGNGMVHIYFKNGDWKSPCYREHLKRMNPDPIAVFLEQPAVDLAMSRNADGWIEVQSRRGSATLREQDGMLEYRTLAQDPFGFDQLPHRMTEEETLRLTWDSEYPDALVQIAQIFRSPRCGDLLLSAEPGYDLRKKWESPEHRSSHGSLRREHMMTPFCMSRSIRRTHPRSVDVFKTVLELLGKELPAGVDGRNLL